MGMLASAEPERLPIAAAKAGSAEAWNTLFARFRLPIYVYAFELLRDHQASLDIVQESFWQAHRYLHSLRDEKKFGSWLFAIAHQKVVQHWRRHRETEPLDLEGDVRCDEALAPDEWLIQKEKEDSMMQLIQQLPAIHRSVLLLHFIEEFSLEEISDVTGLPIGTVKSRLHYAKRTLREKLET